MQGLGHLSDIQRRSPMREDRPSRLLKLAGGSRGLASSDEAGTCFLFVSSIAARSAFTLNLCGLFRVTRHHLPLRLI